MDPKVIWHGREPGFVAVIATMLGIMLDAERAEITIESTRESFLMFTIRDGLSELRITPTRSAVEIAHRSDGSLVARPATLSALDAASFRDLAQQLLNRVQGGRVERVRPD